MNKTKVLQLILMLGLLLGMGILPSPLNAQSLEVGTDEPNPILFIHGWGGIAWVWNDMIDYFKDDGWPSSFLYAYDFDDGGNCSIQANVNNAIKIKLWVDEILSETESEKVDLVGHSMGGLNSRFYIEYLGGIDKVDDYISIASPHHGDNQTGCGFGGVNDFVFLLNEGDMTPGGILNDTIGVRADPIFEYRRYNGSHIPGSINYTSIYVDPDLKFSDGSVLGVSCYLDGAHNILSEPYGHTELIQVEATYQRIISAIGGPYTFPEPTESSSSVSSSLETITDLSNTSLTVSKTDSESEENDAIGFLIVIPISFYVLLAQYKRRRDRN